MRARFSSKAIFFQRFGCDSGSKTHRLNPGRAGSAPRPARGGRSRTTHLAGISRDALACFFSASALRVFTRRATKPPHSKGLRGTGWDQGRGPLLRPASSVLTPVRYLALRTLGRAGTPRMRVER